MGYIPQRIRLYRFEHGHLRQNFLPGHKKSTQILPVRKKTLQNVEDQRTNFPLALAYAVTEHKAQVSTLKEVLADYGPHEEFKIKSYIVPGSFYVGITQVKEGDCLYLRSFDPSYIQVNTSIQSKIDAMIQFSNQFKKVFFDHKIFILNQRN